jgi:hypothetical protein
MIESRKKKIYMISEPGGERGEVDEWREIPEDELRDWDYPHWVDYQRLRKMPEDKLTWEDFIIWWCEENVAFVHIEEDEPLERNYVDIEDQK